MPDDGDNDDDDDDDDDEAFTVVPPFPPSPLEDGKCEPVEGAAEEAVGGETEEVD